MFLQTCSMSDHPSAPDEIHKKDFGLVYPSPRLVEGQYLSHSLIVQMVTARLQPSLDYLYSVSGFERVRQGFFSTQG
jgi:hypothetical protein